jgi:FtsH-binding integral membrane protein
MSGATRSAERNRCPAAVVEGSAMYQPRSPYGRSPYGTMYATGPAVSVPGLLGQVLGITGAGFLVTACAAYIFRATPFGLGFAALIAGLVLLFVMQAFRGNPPVALLLFYAFAFLEGIGLAPLITAYVNLAGPEVVVNAAATTGFGMLVLGGVAFVFSVDWRRFSGLAFGALVALLIVGIVSLFTHWVHPTTYSWLTLAVFTLLTLIDFSRIRAGGDGLTPVQLALEIYLDGINIFLALLRIFSRSRD